MHARKMGELKSLCPYEKVEIFRVQRLLRDAKLMEIAAVTTEIRKIIIARGELLRKSRV